MYTVRLLDKEFSDSRCELENFLPRHIEEDHCRSQFRSESMVRQNDVWLLRLIAFLLIYLFTSIPLLYFTWYRSATSSLPHVPALPYCRFPDVK